MKVIIILLVVVCPQVASAQGQDPVFVLNNPEGHYSNIYRVLVTNDNSTAITLGGDKSICFWDIASSKLIKKLWLDLGENEKGRFIDADMDPNRDLLAVARINSGGMPVVNILDLNKNKVVGTFGGFSKDLGFVRFDPDSKFIVTGTAQNAGTEGIESIKLWKIPGFTDTPFFITRTSAEIEGGPIHDICFYDEGNKLILINIYGKNDGIEIIHNENAIPEYTLRNIKPIITAAGHATYLSGNKKVLSVEHDGKVSLIDKLGNSEELFELMNSGKHNPGDTTASDSFVSKTGRFVYFRIYTQVIKEELSGIIDMKGHPKINYYPYVFNHVVFTSDSTFLGLNFKELKHINFVSGKEYIITAESDYLPDDPIAFGPGKILAFDSLRKSFDFEQLLFASPVPTLEGFSHRKTSYNGILVEQESGNGVLKVDGKSFFFNPWNDVNKYSYLNSGNLLLNMKGYRTNRFSTLLYDIRADNSFWPIIEFVGGYDALSGITPAPDINLNMFATRDVNGLISLYDERNPYQIHMFKQSNTSDTFDGIRIDFSEKTNEYFIVSGNSYKGKLKKKDVLIRIDDYEIDPAKDLLADLELLDTEQSYTIKVRRDGKYLTEEVKLKTIPSIAPLLSLLNKNGEWVCWTPQGYYCSSAGGEKYVGWVISNDVNQLGEYHPIYDFKKQFYRPELIKEIAITGSFDRAVEKYNQTALQPITKSTTISDQMPPSVQWIIPSVQDTTYNKNAIKLRARIISSTEIQNAKILLNGRTVLRRDQINVRQILPTEYEFNFDIELLSKTNTINLFVENKDGSTISEERVLRAEQIVKGLERYKPNLYLLSIGVSEYSIPGYSLTYADKDALSMTQLYNHQKGLLFKDVINTTLINENATRKNILEAFYWLEQNATQKDVVIIFIASHGLNEKDKFYILPYDGDPDRIRITGVDWVNFSDVLGNLPSKVLLFIDACHSGKLGANLLANRGDTDLLEAVRALATEENGVVIMAASTGKEYSVESPEWGHGAFTYALLEGLNKGEADLNSDGIINIREIDYFVADRVKELTKGKQHPTTQKPSVVAEFPLLKVRSN